jgi:hypothetical protein
LKWLFVEKAEICTDFFLKTGVYTTFDLKNKKYHILMNWFLRAKHWQLFALLFGIPLLLSIIFFFVWMFNLMRIGQSGHVDVEAMQQMMFNSMMVLMPGLILIMLIQFAWFWVVGHALYNRLPAHVQMPIGLFKFTSLFPPVYFSVIVMGMILFISKISNFAEGTADPADTVRFFPFLILFHLSAIACIFYNFYFISKTLKSVEMGKEAEFGDYALELLLIWFFSLIGVWFIQPSINKLFAESQ